MDCINCGKNIPIESEFCSNCGHKVIVENATTFSPEDLKKHWPNKFNDWNFLLNGKKEWVGYFNKQIGIIVAIKDKNGNEIPDIKLREPELTGGFGLNLISTGWKNFKKKK